MKYCICTFNNILNCCFLIICYNNWWFLSFHSYIINLRDAIFPFIIDIVKYSMVFIWIWSLISFIFDNSIAICFQLIDNIRYFISFSKLSTRIPCFYNWCMNSFSINIYEVNNCYLCCIRNDILFINHYFFKIYSCCWYFLSWNNSSTWCCSYNSCWIVINSWWSNCFKCLVCWPISVSNFPCYYINLTWTSECKSLNFLICYICKFVSWHFCSIFVNILDCTCYFFLNFYSLD